MRKTRFELKNLTKRQIHNIFAPEFQPNTQEHRKIYFRKQNRQIARGIFIV